MKHPSFIDSSNCCPLTKPSLTGEDDTGHECIIVAVQSSLRALVSSFLSRNERGHQTVPCYAMETRSISACFTNTCCTSSRKTDKPSLSISCASNASRTDSFPAAPVKSCRSALAVFGKLNGPTNQFIKCPSIQSPLRVPCASTLHRAFHRGNALR